MADVRQQKIFHSMKSLEQETFAQLMFFIGMGCLPVSIGLAIAGAACRKIKNAITFFVFAGLAFNHFLFYGAVLGGSLGTKVGSFKLPNWFSFLPYSLIGCAILVGLWIVFDRRRPAVPPPLPKQ